MHTSSKKLAVTLGEPAGIGADIVIQLSQSQDFSDLVVIGDVRALEARAQRLNLSLGIKNLIDVPVKNPSVCGVPDPSNVDGVIAMLDRAIAGCESGEFTAMITGPVHKGIINEAGVPFSGHTEYLAEKTGTRLPVMLLASSSLKVALVTTHLPLKDVSEAVTKERIEQVVSIVDADLKSKFGISEPKILVCGLNPHAGEGGHLGIEEIETIEPALKKLKLAGINVEGPLPADTAFTPFYTEQADVIVAMYHDQGLPVLKSRGFGDAANITLGLPIIRTSVDHGTAFDLAGIGAAHTGGLKTAVLMARQMVARQ